MTVVKSVVEWVKRLSKTSGPPRDKPSAKEIEARMKRAGRSEPRRNRPLGKRDPGAY